MNYIKIPNLTAYPLSAIQDTDLFEICYWDGSKFLTRKVTGAAIKAASVGAAIWGSITGNIGAQTDLMNILEALAPLTNPQFTGNVGINTIPAYHLHVKGTAIPSLNERLAFWEVSDAIGASMYIENGTTADGTFVGQLIGRQSDTYNGSALAIGARISPAQDTGTNPAMIFSSSLSSLQVLVNRPLYSWRNWNIEYMRMLANGNLGLGTQTPTHKLQVAGNARITDLLVDDNLTFGALTALLSASTQWSQTLAAPQTLNNGDTANGCSFFTEASKVANGTTAYNEYVLQSSRNITLTGTSGTAHINVGGVNYLASFSIDLGTTAAAFVTNHAAAILAATGIRVFAQASVLKFAYVNQAALNGISITNVSGALAGTLSITGISHILIPYIGMPYQGLRLNHTMRTNFNIQVGTIQTYELQLRRFADDSVIGSSIAIYRNPDVTGQQFVFETYTAGATDPFVSGGFYFALVNNSGQSVDFIGNAGILIQTTYQKPVSF